MTPFVPLTRHIDRGTQFLRGIVPWLLLAAASASGQTTLTSAVTMALNHSPRVKLAADDLNRARAVVTESRDAYIPNLVANGGAGQSYGITLNVPTIFTVNAQSLVYSSPQHFYLRASKLSVQAALASLQDMREQVEEDTAITYVSLDHVQQTTAALNAELADATALQTIVQARFDAGLENEIELSQTRRQLLAIKLQILQVEDESVSLRQHLAGLTGLQPATVHTVASSIPAVEPLQLQDAPVSTAWERAAVANAQARQQRAAGDASRWSPVISFASQYGRVSPINNVTDYYNLHGKYDVVFAGVSVQFPIFDAARKARAVEARSDAARAEHELQVTRLQREEDQQRLRHSLSELEVRAQIAELDLSIANAQMKATRTQVEDGGDNGIALTPKDERNAHMHTQQLLLDVLEARFQLAKSQISLLRMTGRLDSWLRLPTP